MSLKLLLFIFLFLCITPSAHSKSKPTSDLSADTNLLQTLQKQQDIYSIYSLERVIDGDTLVASGEKIRLWGINTPEKDQPYYLAAKLLLETLIQKGKLQCKFIEMDKYQRSVMHCLIDGSDIGSMMIQMGMAQDYSRYSGDYYQYEEDIAKKEKRGIWKDVSNPK